MGQARGGAPRAFLDLEFREMLMGPPVIAAALGCFSSRDGHTNLFSKGRSRVRYYRVKPLSIKGLEA